MKRLFALLSALVLSLPIAAPAIAKDPAAGTLDMYTVVVDAATATRLSQQELDISDSHVEANGDVTLTVILSPMQRNQLAKTGIQATAVRDSNGRTSLQRAMAQAVGGYTVWRSWDELGGIRDELYDVARRNPELVTLEVLGKTSQGREIIALKVTHDNGKKAKARPAVLYVSNQHAREWISVEVNRRLLHWFIDQSKRGNHEIEKLLETTELWFVVSANPDGYQYTFDTERLWRKNLRDNDVDGQITNADGVDPNRNFDEHWNFDNEGSSTAPSSETYRGASPGSEPETQALAGLIRRIQPRLMVNYHSFGPSIIYPQGWQVGTPDADNPIYAALAGTDANPAIEGFDPGLSSDELYVTNGETTDFADINGNSLAFTPELDEGCDGCGFVFPDDEALIQAEFEKTLPFNLDVARSATDPANPSNHLGNQVKPFYLSQTEVDPENGTLAMFDFRFTKSYGDPQQVRILAKKSLGPVTLKYKINGGATRSASTTEWTGGKRYGPGNGTWFHVVGGTVTGTNPGDSIQVWFEAGGATSQRDRGERQGNRRVVSDSFTYSAVSESGNPVLIMAAEDYTGASPVQTPGPHYLSYYQDALAANGIGADVYDVDANARTAPDALGVLSHYKAVVWYTGDDVITREPGWGPGTASRLAMQELFEVRDFLNEGGKLLYTGKYAGHQYAGGHGTQLYDPFQNEQCTVAIADRCRPLAGSGDGVNDVLEYWFGASLVNEEAGIDPSTGEPFGVVGLDDPYAGASWSFNGADSAANQDHNASFITTSGLLPVDQYPTFNSWPAANYDRPGGPFQPHSGGQYVYSQIGDVSYKRLTRTIDVPASGATMSFWMSRDTELDWDHVFVEAHTVGADDWTTLPDLNGHTTDATGESCPAGWRDLHPFLDHYQTLNADLTCSPTGTTGTWNAATGASGNWEQWQVDLAAYSGTQVELSIAYVSDWSTQGLGVFLDDIEVSTGQGSTSFETGLEGWTVSGPPPGSTANPNDFIVTTPSGFPEGAVIATPDSLYFGFGIEGISDASTRNSVMSRAMSFLLP